MSSDDSGYGGTAVAIDAPAGPISAWLAEPRGPAAGSGPWPGVVLVHDALGLTDDDRRIARLVADRGYVVLAPDLYARGGARRCLRTVFAEMTRGEGRAWDDLEAARRALRDRPDCTGRIGVAGFCMGGAYALLGATKGFDSSAPFYGRLPADDDALAGACPVVASYGARDLSLRGAPERLERVLTRHGVPHDVHAYPGAGHSFANQIAHGPLAGPLNALLRIPGFHYDEPAETDAWRRVFAFFDEHLR